MNLLNYFIGIIFFLLVMVRIRHLITRKQDIRRLILRLANLAGIIGILYVVYLGFSNTDFSGPWWTWNYLGVHHVEDFLAPPIVGGFLILVERVKGYTALLAGGFILAVHEMLWYVAFGIMTTINHTDTSFTVGGAAWIGTTLQVIYMVTIGFYIAVRRSIPYSYLWIMIGVYAFWVLTGFHIRSGYNGLTEYWNDVPTIATEIGSWVVAGIAFCILEFKQMRDIDLRLTYWILALVNLLITKIQRRGMHGFFLGKNREEGRQEEERRRSGRPGYRDSHSLPDDCLRAGSYHHISFDDSHYLMAGGRRTYPHSSGADLRRHRRPSRYLPQGKALLRRKVLPLLSRASPLFSKVQWDAYFMFIAVISQFLISVLIIKSYTDIYPPGACFANGLCSANVNYNQWLGMVFPN